MLLNKKSIAVIAIATSVAMVSNQAQAKMIDRDFIKRYEDEGDLDLIVRTNLRLNHLVASFY